MREFIYTDGLRHHSGGCGAAAGLVRGCRGPPLLAEHGNGRDRGKTRPQPSINRSPARAGASDAPRILFETPRIFQVQTLDAQNHGIAKRGLRAMRKKEGKI